MSTIWDEFQSNTDENGDFPDSFKFEEPGASIAGTITTVKVADFGGGDRKPELYIADATGKAWAVVAGPVQLRAKLSAIRPGIGDGIAITYTHLEQRGGGKTLKHFDVQHNRAPANAPAAQAPASVAQQAPAPAAAPAPAPQPAPVGAPAPAPVAAPAPEALV